jgi:hypothetical protein
MHLMYVHALYSRPVVSVLIVVFVQKWSPTSTDPSPDTTHLQMSNPNHPNHIQPQFPITQIRLFPHENQPTNPQIIIRYGHQDIVVGMLGSKPYVPQSPLTAWIHVHARLHVCVQSTHAKAFKATERYIPVKFQDVRHVNAIYMYNHIEHSIVRTMVRRYMTRL